MTRRFILLVTTVALTGCKAHESVAPKDAPAGGGTAMIVPAGVTPATPEGPRFGTIAFPVSCSPEAQQQFELAVAQLHSFFYPETVKSFERVLEIDPTCVMAYWGLVRSQPPNPLVQPFPPGTYQRGRDAIAKAKAIGARTERERDWLEAAEAYCGGPDEMPYGVRSARYLAAMERLVRRNPDDAEAKTFLALALLESADPHDKRYDNQYRAARLLQGLVASHPNHPGITHYLIHAFDYSPIAGQGLAAANEYAQIAPSAPHALHMPSHIYSMLGSWKASIDSNARTLAVARAYAEKHLPAGVTYTGEVHSLDFMEHAYLQLGKDREALELVQRAASITRTNAPTIAVDAALAVIPVRYAIERGAWAEAAALEPRASAYPYAEAVRLFGRALGSARMGTPPALASAKADIEVMERLRANSAAKQDQGYWAEQTEILVFAASAWVAHGLGDDGEAQRLLRHAAELEDASEKHVAMENRIFPAREQLGYLLLEARQPRQALAEFEASLEMTPNRLRGLYGAATAAKLAGEEGMAREYFRKLQELTADANGDRPEIVEARAVVASRATR